MAKVLHLFNIFGALTEKTIVDLTLGLAGCGHDITIGYETLAAEAPRIALPLVQLKRVFVEPAADVPAQMNCIARTVEDAARRELLDARFDIVHGHFGPRVLHGAAFLAAGTPMIIGIYGYDAGRLVRDKCWIRRYRWAAERGTIFMTIADYLRNRVLEMGIPASQVRLIHLGIDLAAHPFTPTPPPEPPRFVFAGRFVEKKGADVLLKALARLRDNGVSATLDLVGAGPLEDDIRRSVVGMHLEDRVRMPGRVPFDRLLKVISGATALVQPSVTAADGDTEGAPMVLMHAQAIGVPCITTAHAGNPEVIPPEGRRFVVPERNIDALATAMEEMAALDAAQRRSLQTAGRRWIEEHYDMRRTIDACDSLYREITHGRTRGAQ